MGFVDNWKVADPDLPRLLNTKNEDSIPVYYQNAIGEAILLIGTIKPKIKNSVHPNARGKLDLFVHVSSL